MQPSIISPIITMLVSITGIIIPILIYLHYRQQRNDAWLRDFREVHRLFREDQDMKTVRAWLANDQAYESVREIFEMRLEIKDGKLPTSAINAHQYQTIETLDKFLNHMIAIQELNPKIKQHRDLLERALFDYWLRELRDRHALAKYTEKFYGYRVRIPTW